MKNHMKSIRILILGGAFIMSIIASCKRDKEITVPVPVLTTTAVTNITFDSATSGGDITSDGGSPITASGICWSNNPNPTIADSHTADGTTTGSFTSNMASLNSLAVYHVRAYATNSNGTSYGNDISFTTLSDK
ncbi:MAG: hypothetical protein ACKOW2_07265 [Sphingobacteriaceae bacterium]